MTCLNCDQPTILTNFGHPWTGMFNRTPSFIHVCSKCQRSFRDESVKNVYEWVVAIPGIHAKPIIDLMPVVLTITKLDEQESAR